MKVIRTFLAVLIDEDLRQKIFDAQNCVRKCASNVKWVEPDNFHITLKFLGDVAEEQIPEISAVITETVKSVPAFDLSFKGLGAFPRPERARVVWVGIEQGREQLIDMAKALEKSLAALGFDKEDKPFKAHVTIGRVRDNKPTAGLARGLAEIETPDLGTQRVECVSVMQSELLREGPVYSVISESKLLL